MQLFYELTPLIGFGASIILVFAVLRQHRYSHLHRVFSLFLVSMAFWALTTFAMRISPTLERALLWEKAIFVILPVVSASFLHFVWLFTKSRGKAWYLWLVYAVVLIFVSLAPTSLLVGGMKEMWYGHGFVPGPLLFPYMFIFYGFVGHALYLLIKAYRVAESPVVKSRCLYIAVGAGMSLAGLLIDFLAARGIPVYPMGILGNIFFSVLCTYAIVKFHLLDIRVVIRKGIAYLFVATLAIGLYVTLLLMAYLSTNYPRSLFIWLNLVFILLITLSLRPTLHWAQNLVKRLFYRGSYDYLTALVGLGEQTRSSTDLSFIAGTLVKTVVAAMNCKYVLVLLPEATDKYFVTVASQGTTNQESFRLERESALCLQLSHREDFISRYDMAILPQLQALTAREKAMLDSLTIELLMPLMTREGLKGILVLGQKLSGQDYSTDEISLLRVVAHQMANTLDNARLYDLQRRRLREQALLTRLSMVVASELDFEKLCTSFVQELKKTLPIDYVSVNMLDERSKSWLTIFTDTTLDRLSRTPSATDGLPWAGTGMGWVSELEPYDEYDPPSEEKLLADARFRQAGIESVLCLPLRSEKGFLGYCILASQDSNIYDQESRRILSRVALQLAIGIEKSRLRWLESKARLEIERQYQDKTEFINSLIHEVKTPLTAMLASTELLREELGDTPSTLGDVAENLDSAAHNLERRISELMSFVRLQSVTTKLSRQSVDLHEVASQAVLQVTGLFRNKSQTIKLEVSPSIGRIQADPERLNQILLNLLTNASRFSALNSQIYLQAYPNNGDLIVTVRDGAPPISHDEAQLVFTPYYRGKNRVSGGLGLGLSICKKLVELHGGRIWVETSATGNQFKFSLPLS